MALNSSSRSPREEGELEDGEISDDDNDENQLVCPDKRPSSSNSNAGRSSRSCKPQPRPLSPHISGPGHDYRMNMQFNRGPHPPKSIGHRQKGGPNGPGRPGSGPLCEFGPRSSFWERSNSAFDRLGLRGRWTKSFGRPALRKPNYSTAKNVNGIEDSFEDLLKKYKQIQHELECIQKEERTAFTSKEESPRKEPAVSVSARQSIPVPSSIEEVEGENAEEAVAQDAQKPFQAFNLKPLRQKLLTPAERDQINKVPGKEEPALEEIELSLAEPSSTAKEKRRAEEEGERRKREEEIRKIRDLSNQDEQYNRFMKLVGGKRSSRSKTSDSEHRKSLNKQGTDASGNLYQYDNYDEVAMETDSETNSPAKSFGRPALRKPNYSTAKNVNGIEDSFEDLLMKYKQIQHELECIQKEERTAFTSKEESPRKEPAVSVSARQSIPVPSSIEEVEGENAEEAVAQDAQKPFQAFNLKPLRQKLLTPAERDQINKVPGKEEPALEEIELSLAEPSSTAKESVETDPSISYASSKESDDLPEKEVVKDDDDEVSEMQLRLLALQSASKKWQQKEQQVLKESKEKLSKTRPAQQKGKAAVKPHCGKKSSSAGSATKQAWRKQQVRTWKLQQQKEQEKRQREDEEKRRAEEEEERRKREEEIRKIRDLSNQDEQYNRFMKLVGGKRSSRSKTSDSEHRKSLNKQGTDASGNLYQYDNYDEVAMETDSETNSPVSSPMHNPFVPELPPYFQMAPFPMGLPPHTVTMQSLNEQYLDSLDPMEPPPPLPPLPPDEPEQPPKPPFADEEEEEEMLLREELLKSLASKRPVKSESASKKWQQKEQQVLKESKEKLSKTRPAQQKGKAAVKPHCGKKSSSAGSATKQAWRKQQVRTWKLQQQKEQEKRQREDEEKRRAEEEEERRKREEEIRKIRDLSNQDEQYNRFMKLVGGKRSSRSKASKPKTPSRSEKENNQVKTPEALPVDKKIEYRLLKEEIASREQQRILKSSQSRGSPSPASSDVELEFVGRSVANLQTSDSEHRKSLNKQGTDASGNLYQYDNYDEVAMETDSETNSPVSSPMHNPFVPELPPYFQMAPFPMGLPPHTVLPRHKAVVVQLNNSDDSESDGESSGSSRFVFGGLESMIKEARRTAEASKPKTPSRSEKENNQVKTPEALPVDKKIEYRLLKEEIASREQQRILKSSQSRGSPSPASSDVELEFVGRSVANLQTMQSLNEQYLDSLDPMEPPPPLPPLPPDEPEQPPKPPFADEEEEEEMLLREELLSREQQRILKSSQSRGSPSPASSDVELEFVGRSVANLQVSEAENKLMKHKNLLMKDEMLLKHLVQQELKKKESLKASESKSAGLKEQLLATEKIVNANKTLLKKLQEQIHRVQHRVSTKRNQALKFEKDLAQAKANAGHGQSKRKSEVNYLSIHRVQHRVSTKRNQALKFEKDLAQAKANAGHGQSKRKSEVNYLSASKPKTPSRSEKENNQVKTPEALPVDKKIEYRLLKEEIASRSPVASFKMKSLLLIFSLASKPKTPSRSEKENNQVKTPEALPVDKKIEYRLLKEEIARFSPYFRTKEKLYLSSVSYSNIIEPKKCFCRFDLTGTCNDDDCQWQHMRDCTLSRSQLFQDILSYNLPVVGCSETSTGEEISVATEKYLDKLFGMNKDRMATDPMAVLLVSKINESKSHTPPYTTCKELRKWRPQQRRKPDPDSSSSDDEESKGSVRYDRSWKASCALDVCVTPDDVRYFTSETDDISNLEASVVESPRDVQLWIKLAYNTPSECLDSVLNTLARALEDNRENPEVWCHYLNLFAKRGTKDEVQEMCETAVEYAPDYKVWWNFLNLETSFDGKDYVCGRMLQFLLGTAGGDNKSELLSFQLLESLLYRVQLSLFTGRHQNALAILQNALKSTDGERSLAEHLILSDRCLAWLAYIHLIEFNSLPGRLYDPAHTNPARIVNKEPFLIPWQSLQDVKTDPDMLFALFEELSDQLSSQIPYMWLIHCLWQTIHASVGDAVDAFERALGTVMQQDVVQKLWLDYLLFTSSKLIGSKTKNRDFKMFTDLVHRCLVTVPTRFIIPLSSADYWTNFEFHNKVVSFYLSCLPKSQHSKALERFRSVMPANTDLALRLLWQEWHDGNIQHLKHQARTLTSRAPMCLTIWKIAIAVEKELKGLAEQLLFEASEGGKTDNLRKLVAKCQEVGVSLDELLNLSSNRPEGKDH
ncbi:UNVERIFIED_CONTAM: hypothetical protein FKN15_060253 [Acipenser sinensis]